MVIMRSTPAVRARSTTPSRSSAKSGKSRWQWLSMIVIQRRPRPSLRRLRFDIARKDRRRRGQQRAGLEPMWGPDPPKRLVALEVWTEDIEVDEPFWRIRAPHRLVYLDIFGPHFEGAEIAFVWRRREEIKQLVHRGGHD